ncbi:hypothetical protein AB0E01_07320 [Nocardia vinacea]|uniref:hypothetical protein n=1 Tax=Nocardia vinacea TaxID=96468 RepID=UPI0033D2345D
MPDTAIQISAGRRRRWIGESPTRVYARDSVPHDIHSPIGKAAVLEELRGEIRTVHFESLFTVDYFGEADVEPPCSCAINSARHEPTAATAMNPVVPQPVSPTGCGVDPTPRTVRRETCMGRLLI